MNRKEFQEWLDQFPEDTEIEVVIQDAPMGFSSYGQGREVPFTGEQSLIGDSQYEYTDFTNNKFVSENSTFYNKRVLVLGEIK